MPVGRNRDKAPSTTRRGARVAGVGPADAHGGDFLPDDWRYTCIRAAVDFLADGGDADDGAEFADQHVDVYTGARLQWLASNLRRPGYVDEAVDDMGAQDLDTVERIGLGQYAEASEVFGLVVQSLTERLEEEDAGEAA